MENCIKMLKNYPQRALWVNLNNLVGLMCFSEIIFYCCEHHKQILILVSTIVITLCMMYCWRECASCGSIWADCGRRLHAALCLNLRGKRLCPSRAALMDSRVTWNPGQPYIYLGIENHLCMSGRFLKEKAWLWEVLPPTVCVTITNQLQLSNNRDNSLEFYEFQQIYLSLWIFHAAVSLCKSHIRLLHLLISICRPQTSKISLRWKAWFAYTRRSWLSVGINVKAHAGMTGLKHSGNQAALLKLSAAWFWAGETAGTLTQPTVLSHNCCTLHVLSMPFTSPFLFSAS